MILIYLLAPKALRRMPICCRSLLLYRRVALLGLGDKPLPEPWPCYELSKEVFNQPACEHRLAAVLERFEVAGKALKQVEQQLQASLSRYCATVCFRTAHEDTAEELSLQLEQLATFKEELKELQPSHLILELLLVDCSGLQKEPFPSSSRWFS